MSHFHHHTDVTLALFRAEHAERIERARADRFRTRRRRFSLFRRRASPAAEPGSAVPNVTSHTFAERAGPAEVRLAHERHS